MFVAHGSAVGAAAVLRLSSASRWTPFTDADCLVSRQETCDLGRSSGFFNPE